MQVSGRVIGGEELSARPGRLVIEDGRIEDIEETTESATSSDIIVPAFINAHTHIGDSITKEAGRGLSLDELVAPPDGLKHRLLRDAPREQKVDAMRRSIRFMKAGGTAAFIDFREGGRSGVHALREAAGGLPVTGFAFGRGDPDVLDIADGYGASGARDADFGPTREKARQLGKPLGIHAGERDTADIHDALDLRPDHLVHMVHAEEIHLDRVENAEVPVVVCPRSNLVTGVGRPPVPALLERTTVALGTDNVMMNNPSMFREMEFTAKLFDIDAGTVLEMATINGAELVDTDCGVIEPGRPAAFFVLDGSSDNLVGYQDPVRAVVRRAGVEDVKRVHLPVS